MFGLSQVTDEIDDTESNKSTNGDVDDSEELDTFDMEISIYPNQKDPTRLLSKDNKSPPTANWKTTFDRFSPATVVKIKPIVKKGVVLHSTQNPSIPTIFRPISPILTPISPVNSPRNRSYTSPRNIPRSKSQEIQSQEIKPLPKDIFDFFKIHYNFFINILTFVLFSTFLTFLMLSILKPEIMEILFYPALNIFQTQLITGIGIFISIIMGIKQSKDYCLKNEADENEDQHDSSHVYSD